MPVAEGEVLEDQRKLLAQARALIAQARDASGSSVWREATQAWQDDFRGYWQSGARGTWTVWPFPGPDPERWHVHANIVAETTAGKTEMRLNWLQCRGDVCKLDTTTYPNLSPPLLVVAPALSRDPKAPFGLKGVVIP